MFTFYFAETSSLSIHTTLPIVLSLTARERQIGVTGRAKIGEGEDDKDNLFGYRGFVEYDILKNIFLHGEYERTGLMVTDPTTELEARQWTDRWLLGLGTDIQMPGLLNGTLMILYNFDDDIANSPNPRRFQVRYGIKIN